MGKRDKKQHGEGATIKALTHPLRVDILIRLAEVGRLSARQYEIETGEELNLVAYHLRVLERYGAVELVDTRQRRGAVEHFWAIAEDSPIIHALLGSQLVSAEHGASSETSGILSGRLGPGGGSSGMSFMVPMELDAAGLDELKDIVDGKIADILGELADRVKVRLMHTGDEASQFHVGITAFPWERTKGNPRRQGSSRRKTRKPKKAG